MANKVCQMSAVATKVFGSAESDASREFWSKATPIDVSKELEPDTTLVAHFTFEDMSVTAHIGRGIVEAQKHLMININDVVVASHPKTGTTWLQEIVYSLINQDELDKPITLPIDIRAPQLEIPECGFQPLQLRPSPRVLKTHAHFQMLPNGNCDKKYKIVYITRNPKDTAISLFHFYKMMDMFQFNGSQKEFLNLFLAGKAFFGPFDKSVLSYWNQRHLDNVLIVKYEDLQKISSHLMDTIQYYKMDNCNFQDVHSEIRRIAKFLQVEVDEAVVDKIAVRCGFDQMAKNPLLNHTQWTNIDKCADKKKFNFMRSGKVGDWRNQFDEETNRKFDEWIEKSFENSDITFEY